MSQFFCAHFFATTLAAEVNISAKEKVAEIVEILPPIETKKAVTVAGNVNEVLLNK